jgi:xanthosine utilization system XapX-like protein
MRGRTLPLPPVVPLVGALGVLLGVVLGSGLAPRGVPLAAPSPAAIAATSPSSKGEPSVFTGPTASPLDEAVTGGSPLELPPTGGLSLAQALEALGATGMGASPADVISARIVRYAEVSSSSIAPGNEWVWAIVIRGSFPPVSCGGYRLGSPAPCLSPAPTERIVLDYRTGAFLEATTPALP